MCLEKDPSNFSVTPFFCRKRTPHSSKRIQNNTAVGSTRQRVVEYSLGTLQAHLQNKCVITKYDYCGYGNRIPTIPLRPHPRTVYYIYWTPPPSPVYGLPFTCPLLCGRMYVQCGDNGGGSRICSGHPAECNFTKQYNDIYLIPCAPSRLVCQQITTWSQPVFIFVFLESDFRNPPNGWPLHVCYYFSICFSVENN